AWGKSADIAGQYLRKGSKICIEGHLSTRSWEDPKKGEKRYYTDIVTDHITFVGRNSDAKGAEESTRRPDGGVAGSRRKQVGPGASASQGPDDAEDLPF